MAPALGDLESIILEKMLRRRGDPVFLMCACEAVVERDSAGNGKLSKKRSTGSLNGMIAVAIALGVTPLCTAVKFAVDALIA